MRIKIEQLIRTVGKDLAKFYIKSGIVKPIEDPKPNFPKNKRRKNHEV
jgi:hypothetical protein